MQQRIRQMVKAVRLARRPSWRHGLKHGIGASIEHLPALAGLDVRTVVDVGANKGQFSLLALEIYPGCRIFAFEPLAEPARKYRACLERWPQAKLFEVAVAAQDGEASIYVSGREDSSSLLPITEVQSSNFPGTGLKEVRTIRKLPLDRCLAAADIVGPALLKIDVQGFELEVLKGSADLLDRFTWVYVECSFVELYEGQALAGEVTAFLEASGFAVTGQFNGSHGKDGVLLQEDRLFERVGGAVRPAAGPQADAAISAAELPAKTAQPAAVAAAR